MSKIEEKFKQILNDHFEERQTLIRKLEHDPKNNSLKLRLADLCERTGIPARYISKTEKRELQLYKGKLEYDHYVWSVYFPESIVQWKELGNPESWSYKLECDSLDIVTHEGTHPLGVWSESHSC
jgi:hypothetical protein